MMRRSPPVLLAALVVSSALFGAGCQRETRRFNEVAPSSSPANRVAVSALRPGGQSAEVGERSPYMENAWAISEGKRLFDSFNCSGCHGHGGGAMGPALMDDRWIYGSDPAQIYASIVEGRPNGMPTFRRRLTEQQAWELVAYVRSLSGLVPKDAAGIRDDHMQVKPSESSMPNPGPKWMGSLP